MMMTTTTIMMMMISLETGNDNYRKQQSCRFRQPTVVFRPLSRELPLISSGTVSAQHEP